MVRRREKNDGLPHRVYERVGVRDYSIGYKAADGTWTFRLSCPVSDKVQVAETRREAIKRAVAIGAGGPTTGSVAALIDAWMAFQHAIPVGSESRRADTTLAGNKPECENLKVAFGHMRAADLEKQDAYAYLDACLVAVDKEGKPRPRPAKGNKEISLMRTILEYGIRTGVVKVNVFEGVEKLKTRVTDRLVTDQEMALAVEIGREMGGARLIVALALRTAWLCVKRSVEVRALTRSQITDEGIVWEAGKRQGGQAKKFGLIEWSPELRKTIDEALAVKRNKVAGTWYIFGNLSGQKYTKGGWKKMLHYLMNECEARAAQRGIPFQKFNLQECRPKGVTDKLEQGDTDVMDATMHTNERMIQKTYDRRRLRIAKPVQ